MTPFEFKKRDKNRNLIYMAVVDRTTYIEQTIESIKEGKVRLPFKDGELEWVLNEFCAINSSAESDMKSGRQIGGQTLTKYMRWRWPRFMRLLYAQLAIEMREDEGLPTMRTFGA